jgi:hypothetical protein
MKASMRMERQRLGWLFATALVAAGLHAWTPAGPHSWHWLHLLAGKLYYLPIVMAAAWFGTRVTAAVTLAVSALSLAHIARNWAGLPMVQAEQLAEIVTFWVVGMVCSWLFGRERAAREATRVAHGETLGALASSLELREQYTGGHSRRVRDYALLLADAMGIRDSAFLASLAQGALLHDVGKIGIPDRVLLKPAELAPAERALMRRHPEMGAALVGHIAWLRGPAELIRAHHERYDGSGYPRGLSGEAIPLAARIFAVGDAFDALTTDRPYHEARSWEEAALTIAAGRGSQFDPDVADAFSRIAFERWAGVAAATRVNLRRAAASEGGSRLADQPAEDPVPGAVRVVDQERL